ncbi:MAG TPA: hypothetical protein VM510_03840, partial [Caulifigura sp.]|nr:hypothetical protein [Caulifigura sp.]
VLPDQDAVVAITSDTSDLQGELNVVWDELLPAFQSSPLAENPTELDKLRESVKGLKVRHETAKK